ncbi:MAG: twin-arginine translocation signal domain-containing protein, partial [Bacteroidales bacterium]|nr:twin-arginine translocation signal domain-containing protein [Bacteroidales bacterium]
MKRSNQKSNKNGASRRQFIKQSAMAGGALVVSSMLPRSLFAASNPVEILGIINQTIISKGWKIKSIDPVRSLKADIFTDASNASEAGGWLALPSAPAMPHEILLHYKKIKEPWKPFGMENCYWVSQKDWVYTTDFAIKNTIGEYRLIFNELKGKVDIHLNGELVASYSDQSHPLVIDVTGKLNLKNNLLLHFQKAAPAEQAGQPDPSKRKLNGNYLGANPMIYTSGIAGDILLERTDGSLIHEIITDFSLNDTFTKGEVNFILTGKSRYKTVKVQVRLVDQKGKQVAITTALVDVENGSFSVQPKLSVLNPELWWPRGYGEQKLYKAEIELLISGKLHQKEIRTIGFRKITMPENLLHFVVNGKPVFLRGGNWVTPNLLSDVWDQERIGKLLDLAENANFNAFRIWGDVIAPKDKFYEMADERGFLLWQDFTGMPFYRNSDKLEESKELAKKLLKRLKHHPCILLWCGINEAAMWWHEDYNNAFTDQGPWPGLAAAKAVEQVCMELDPDRYYIPSAPFGGINANEPREGSTNGYTNMWYVPGYDYLNFASEDTRIACPTLSSMEKFMLPEEICPKGYTTIALHGNKIPFPETWLAYTSTESWKKTGPVEQFYDANDAASLANRIGMAEGVYYQNIIERQRRGRPSIEDSDRRCCGGYIVWKYNDSWVSIYSAKVDYFLEPYHVYYTLRAAYAPVILSFDIDTYIYLWAVNDSTEPVTGTVKIQLYHLELCEFRKEIVREVSLAPGKSKVVVRLDEAGIRAFRKEHILFAELKSNDGQVLARTNALADIERRCTFPDAKLEVKLEGNCLVIS